MTGPILIAAARASLALFALLLASPVPAADDPTALITAIYQQVSAGKGTRGGQFVWLHAKDRPKRLSKSLTALWNKADALTPKGDQGPIGFDPVTNSQDPLVQAFVVKTERQDAKTAIVAAILSDKKGPVPADSPYIIRYDLVLENGRWKIDDMRGTIDTEWSVRKLLADYKG